VKRVQQDNGGSSTGRPQSTIRLEWRIITLSLAKWTRRAKKL
jgi:hypothetical protein